MHAVPHTRGRGLALLAAHCASLEPGMPCASERLVKAVGVQLAHTLVFGLCGRGSVRR